MAGVIIRGETQKGECYVKLGRKDREDYLVKMEAETRMMRLQNKEHQGLPEPRKR